MQDVKLGTFTGKELRERGLELRFDERHSPLKVVRMSSGRPSWAGKYRAVNVPGSSPGKAGR